MNLDFTGVEHGVLLLIAAGLTVGILVGIAGTAMYPLAVAAVIVAMVYVIAHGGDVVVAEVSKFLTSTLGGGK